MDTNWHERAGKGCEQSSRRGGWIERRMANDRRFTLRRRGRLGRGRLLLVNASDQARHFRRPGLPGINMRKSGQSGYA